MENVGYIGLSRQIALHEQMDVVAHNIANLNTPGFKSQNMVFAEHLVHLRGRPEEEENQVLSMVLDYGTYRNLDQGSFTQTNNQLDFALSGDGYFGVETQAGTRYTRAGNFILNMNRELVTQSGDLVQGTGGGAIVIPEGENKISVTRDGSITTENGQVGQLKVVRFENPHDMLEISGGLYSTEQAELPVENTEVLQGAIEKSNVQGVIEMTKMIDVLRSYQNMQRMLQTDHERQRTVIQRLSRTQ